MSPERTVQGASRPPAPPSVGGLNQPAVIVVVTPTYNSEQFLDDTIMSVVSQAGDFHLRYHIQDGGSRDATMKIIRRWQRLLHSTDFSILCASLDFSYDSSPDSGMYQAINRGVARARPKHSFVMGWINSDDRLAPGALAAVHGIYEQLPEVNFTCARVSMIDRHGVITGINLPVGYDRQKLSDGLYDGRSHSFVMQEGTFWRSALWDQVGGLDERFRLAGDWDLWRRFAHHSALSTIDSVLAFHRRHDSQLSASLYPYYAEIDAADPQPRLSHAFAGHETGETLKFNLGSKKWERTRWRGTRLEPPIVQQEGEAVLATYRVELTSGARLAEGPYPEVNLPSGMRWIDKINAEAVVTVPYPGLWRMHLRVRNWRPDLRLLIMREAAICLDVRPRAGEDSSDTLLSASLWLEGGGNTLRIVTAGPHDATGGWLFVLLEWYVLPPLPPPASDPASPAVQSHHAAQVASSGWPVISVVLCAGSDGPRLDLRLDAVLAQAYPDVEIYVIDETSSAVDRQIMAAYAARIARVDLHDGEHRHTAIGRAIDRSTGVLLAVMDDTATLAPGALFALAATSQSDACPDLIAGITVEQGRSTTARRLPALADGRLQVRDLLRSGVPPGSAHLFDHGGLFFARRIWHAAGGHLMIARPACAAFDFWIRCAAIGAKLQMMPTDLIHRTIEEHHRTGEQHPGRDDVSPDRSRTARSSGDAGHRHYSAIRAQNPHAGCGGCRRPAEQRLPPPSRRARNGETSSHLYRR